MEKKVYTTDELNNASREDLVGIVLSLQGSIARMMENQELIMEQISLLRQQRFGRHSEKMDVIDGQISLFFNEPEADAAQPGSGAQEPELEEVVIRRKKRKKGKREDDLKDIPVTVVEHTMSEDEPEAAFPDGKYKRLPDEVYKRLELHPASFEVKEHHVAVYAGMDNETIIKAEHPKDLLRGSIATPSLEAAIINGKYVNSMPLYRMEQEFKRNDVNLNRQNMANRTIQCADRYLAVLYDRLHKLLYGYHVLQADETPVEVTKDGRPAGAKSYMWIYRTGKSYKEAIVLYEYQKDRKADHPQEFLKGFQGICVTDGYQAYHSLEEKTPGLTIAGCRAHARRKYAEALKAIRDKEKRKDTLACDALKQIGAMYKLDNEPAGLGPVERQHRRQLELKPLTDAYFAWIKEHQCEVPPKSQTGKAFAYSINQEKYLRVFLDDGEVPLDNNATESTLRGFCIGKHNWRLIDTVRGAKSSAIIYSITETAKANGLKVYEYVEHLLTEIPKHMDDTDLSFLDDLLPWSANLPERCRKSNKYEVK
ncbi:MAG: IS66 family transposase [Eubacterium sp.]|nr:IS66 family transposase [Eubacterium sp.]